MPDQDGEVMGDGGLDDRAWDGIAVLYDQPGVRAAAHRLQDDPGLSVTLLLTLLWYAAREGRTPGRASLMRVIPAVQAVESQVLRVLRNARAGADRLGDSGVMIPAAVRRRLLDVELAYEREQQRLLLTVLDEENTEAMVSDDPLAAGCLALARYLAIESVIPTAEQTQALHHLLAAALGDYDGLHLTRIWQRAWDQVRTGT